MYQSFHSKGPRCSVQVVQKQISLPYNFQFITVWNFLSIVFSKPLFIVQVSKIDIFGVQAILLFILQRDGKGYMTQSVQNHSSPLIMFLHLLVQDEGGGSGMYQSFHSKGVFCPGGLFKVIQVAKFLYMPFFLKVFQLLKANKLLNQF